MTTDTDTDTIVVELHAIRQVGSIAVGSGYREDGKPTAVAIDLHYAQDIADAIGRGESPIVVVESWAIVNGLWRV